MTGNMMPIKTVAHTQSNTLSCIPDTRSQTDGLFPARLAAIVA